MSVLWGCLTVLETIAAVIALPVGIAMLAFGNDEGWWVLGFATFVLVAFFVQLWRRPGEMPEPFV